MLAVSRPNWLDEFVNKLGDLLWGTPDKGLHIQSSLHINAAES